MNRSSFPGVQPYFLVLEKHQHQECQRLSADYQLHFSLSYSTYLFQVFTTLIYSRFFMIWWQQQTTFLLLASHDTRVFGSSKQNVDIPIFLHPGFFISGMSLQIVTAIVKPISGAKSSIASSTDEIQLSYVTFLFE